MMAFKRAFECRKCPQRNDEQGCPAWWEIVETNLETKEERITKGCGWTLMPRFMIEVIKASNRPAAAVESCRNEIATGFQSLSTIMQISAEKQRKAISG